MVYAVWTQTAVLLMTLLVVGWYTFETSKLRKEMVRQNRISLRPIVVPHFANQHGTRTFSLNNCGVGCALNVRVSTVKIPDEITQPLRLGECEFRFETAYYMASKEHLPISYSLWANGAHIPKSPLYHWFFPDLVTRRISFRISFEDVEGQSYEIPVTVEAAGTRASEPGAVVIGAIEEIHSSIQAKPEKKG